jgi:hypothetical protein
MTALTMPTRPGHDAHLRPVPWRRTVWVTWRQHRGMLAGVAALLGLLALYLWFTGVQIHHSYAADCHPAASVACTINFSGKYSVTVNVVRALLQVVPALIGAFAGAPLLAREMETGTFRYAWTQGIGRWRWTLATLVPLAVVVSAAAWAFSMLFSWYLQPFSAAGYSVPFTTDIFDLRQVAFTGWTLAAFAIGALAGMVIRRVVPAIAATLAVYAGLAAATALWLRQHYIAPLLTSKLNLPAGSWIVNQWYDKGGKYAFPNRGAQIIAALHQACPSASKPGGASNGPPQQCLTQHGYTWWASYQPGSRFWPFQWIEGGWLVALSVLLIAATIWLVSRRAT